ncbi:MAG: hypothetical protein ABI160_05175 [Mycobacteriaceae bacterium]
MNDPGRCAVCGQARPDGGAAALEGSTTHDGDQVSWTCARCTREHARSMEARLDERWW